MNSTGCVVCCNQAQALSVAIVQLQHLPFDWFQPCEALLRSYCRQRLAPLRDIRASLPHDTENDVAVLSRFR